MKKKGFRVAVIGCGAISETHILGIRNSGNELCALCDIALEKSEALCKKYNLSVPLYTDAVELLEKEQPDAVHICTPHYLHAPMCIDALQRDIAVLCEKPLCISARQLAEIRYAAAHSHATLGVCLQNRYQPNMLFLKENISEKIKAGSGFVVWNRDASYYNSAEWRGTPEKEGGGVLINQALHTLDLLQWICGMPVSLTANISNDHLSGIIGVEDTASILMKTANGIVLNFFATTAGGTDFPAQLRIQTTDGSILSAENGLLCLDGVVKNQTKTAFLPGKAVWGNRHEQLIADFYNCLADGRQFPIGLEEGAKSVRLVLAAYASHGKSIPVAD